MRLFSCLSQTTVEQSCNSHSVADTRRTQCNMVWPSRAQNLVQTVCYCNVTAYTSCLLRLRSMCIVMDRLPHTYAVCGACVCGIPLVLSRTKKCSVCFSVFVCSASHTQHSGYGNQKRSSIRVPKVRITHRKISDVARVSVVRGGMLRNGVRARVTTCETPACM